jgi:hypothetical protein
VLGVLGIPNVVSAGIVTLVVAVLFRARVFGVNERTETSWIDAWLKAGVIVVFVVFFAVFLPSYVIQTETVAGYDRKVQDLIGSGLFGGAFVATLAGLRYAHRSKRV